MRIAALTYDFPTPKVHDHWMCLVAHGWRPELVLAAPRVDLGRADPRRRQAPQGRILTHPRDLAAMVGATYVVVPHSWPAAAAELRDARIDLGLVLGARILASQTISACRIGVLNLHPGWLPDVRGLDTIKWPLLRGLPLGATAHLIDERIDRGRLVCRQQVERLSGDTLLDIQLRVWDIERQLMLDALSRLRRNPDTSTLEALGPGEYFGQMPAEVEDTLDL